MNRLLERLVRKLLGDGAIDGLTDERMDGIELAIQEEFARLKAQEA